MYLVWLSTDIRWLVFRQTNHDLNDETDEIFQGSHHSAHEQDLKSCRVLNVLKSMA